MKLISFLLLLFIIKVSSDQRQLSQKEVQQRKRQEAKNKQQSLVMTCLLLVKEKIALSSREFAQAIKAFDHKDKSKQELFYYKINAIMMDICVTNVKLVDVQHFMININNPNFETLAYQYVFDKFKWPSIIFNPKFSLLLTQKEAKIMKYAESIEELIKTTRQMMELKDQQKKIADNINKIVENPKRDL